MARLAGSLLTLVSIICASLGMWRMGTDLAWTAGFVFSDGFLSHWQVWIGTAVAMQYVAWRLTNYARATIPETVDVALAEESATREGIIARV